MHFPRSVLIGFLIFFITLGTYAYSAARAPTGHADSDEILTVSYSNGVAHPPGYPLQIFLTGFAMRYLPIDNQALAGHLTASFSQALSISFLYGIGLLSYLIAARPKRSKPDELQLATIASAAGALVVAFSGLYWLYGGVVEVMSLNNALISATLFVAFLWWYLPKERSHPKILFYLTWLLAGLSLAHVHTAILMFPALLAILIMNRKVFLSVNHKTLFMYFSGGTILLFAGFLLPQLLTWFNNLSQPEFSWYFTPTLEGLTHLITRQDYTGFFFDDNQTRAAYLFGFSDRIFNVHQAYFQYLWQHLSILGVLFGLIGIYSLYKASRQVFWVIMTLWLVAGPLFNSYMGFPKYDPANLEYAMEVGITQRQFLVSHLIFGLFIIWGFYGIFIFLRNHFQSKTSLILVLVISISSVTWLIYDNHHIGIQRHNRLVSTYARQALDATEPNSIVICSADVSCFSLAYATIVEGYRSDVTVLTKNSLLRKHHLDKYPDLYPFSYHDNPYFYSNLVAWNLHHRPVYLTNPSTNYIEFIGMDANPFYLVPTNYLFKVVPKVPTDPLPEPYYEFTTKLLNPIPAQKDAYMNGLLDLFSSFHNTAGVLYANFGYPDYAKRNYELSLSLNPTHEASQKWLAGVDDYQGNPAYAPDSFVELETFFQQADKLIQDNQIDKAYQVVRKSSYLKPTDPNIRLALVNLYLLGGYQSEALTELDHILLFTPEYQPALDLKQSLLATISSQLIPTFKL